MSQFIDDKNIVVSRDVLVWVNAMKTAETAISLSPAFRERAKLFNKKYRLEAMKLFRDQLNHEIELAEQSDREGKR